MYCYRACCTKIYTGKIERVIVHMLILSKFSVLHVVFEVANLTRPG